MVKKGLDLKIDKSVFWTDSTCVLGYINNADRRFKTYVANRVSAILEISSPSQWKYINTKLNPADDASRGLSAGDLIKNGRWKNGPQFLSEPEGSWPAQPDSVVRISESDSELTKEANSLVSLSSSDNQFNVGDYFNRVSSWSKLKKCVAWMLRFKALLRDLAAKKKGLISSERKELKPISVSELQAAEILIIKCVQRESFKDELSMISVKSTKSTKRSSSIRKLDPV